MRKRIMRREIRSQGTLVAGRVLDPHYGTFEKTTLAHPKIEFLTFSQGLIRSKKTGQTSWSVRDDH